MKHCTKCSNKIYSKKLCNKHYEELRKEYKKQYYLENKRKCKQRSRTHYLKKKLLNGTYRLNPSKSSSLDELVRT